MVAAAHMVGIGGAGMSALATVLSQSGWQITGSDQSPQGLTLPCGTFVGHCESHLPVAVDFIIHSLAVPGDNPELAAARARGVPVLSYPEMLGRLMAAKQGLAIAGTHGKSTTTAMATAMFALAGLDPTAVVGATPIGQPSGGRLGHGPHILVEACEYRRSFFHLPAHSAVLLGIEADHFDCYESASDVQRSFDQFVGRIAADGLLVANIDCVRTRRIACGRSQRVEWFGLANDADWQAVALAERRGLYEFDLVHNGKQSCHVRLRVPGRHNVHNALAATALAAAHGVAMEIIAESLAEFRGLHRRLEVIGCEGGVTLVDDYAHHPTEVSATLATLREMFPGRKLWCVFQPHQASRMRSLLDGLAESLHNADTVIVTDVYRARESAPQVDEPTAADLARRVAELGAKANNISDPAAIADHLVAGVRAGDVVVTIGAGDIGKLIHELAKRFRERRAPG